MISTEPRGRPASAPSVIRCSEPGHCRRRTHRRVGPRQGRYHRATRPARRSHDCDARCSATQCGHDRSGTGGTTLGGDRGQPLFVIEVLRAGVSPEGRQAALTPTMRAVLGARLGQLPDGARRLAEVAAVIGRPFSVGLLVSATGIGEPELVDHLDELWRRRIIRDQGLTYDFSHDKLRAVALEMLSPARRRQLHRAVAKAIAVEFRHDLAVPGATPAGATRQRCGRVPPGIYRPSPLTSQLSRITEGKVMEKCALAGYNKDPVAPTPLIPGSIRVAACGSASRRTRLPVGRNVCYGRKSLTR